MCNWLHLLGVHSRNISFDEDDIDINMTVSDGGENSSDDLDSADELYESFVRMMRRGKLTSIVHMHVYIYRPAVQVYMHLSLHDRSAKRSSSLVYREQRPKR